MRRFALPCLALSFAAALHAAEDEHSWTPLRDGADKAIQAAAAFETAQRKQTTSPRIQLIPHGLVTISIDERLQALRASQDAENGIPLEEESSIGSVDPAVLMRNVEAALDAVASPSLIPEENAPSAGEAADAAGRAAAELIAAPVKDPLDDACWRRLRNLWTMYFWKPNSASIRDVLTISKKCSRFLSIMS